MDSILLDRFFNTFPSKKIAVIGDFALDFYFNLQPKTNEYSVETSKEVFHANSPKTSLGGAGNVCKNLAHLGLKPHAFGFIGEDLFGREMTHLMGNLSIDFQNIQIDQQKGTPVYSKPMEGPVEYHRIDFGTTDTISSFQKEAFMFQMAMAIQQFDGVILNEQFFHPLLNEADLLQLQQIIRESKVFAIADLRSLGKFANEVILKINLKEFSELIQIPVSDLIDLETIKKEVNKLIGKRSKGILITLGELGILYADHTTLVHEPSIPTKGTIDTVGAGDMVVAAFSAAILSGASPAEACQFANLCAHISIHKIGETGSASWEEIMNYEL